MSGDQNGWPWASGDRLRNRHIWLARDPAKYGGIAFKETACGGIFRIVLQPAADEPKCVRCAKLEQQDAIA